MTNIAVSGSTAYDFIMDFKGNLAQEVHAWLTHALDVSFSISEMKKDIWGTGLNIAYNLALLWERSVLLTAVWVDFEFSDFMKENIELDFIHTSAKKMTASAYITSDASQNQITAFYPWATDEADSLIARNVTLPINYGIISPNKKEAMISHLNDMYAAGVKVFFDPGQQLSTFSNEELLDISQKAHYLIVNDNEYSEFKAKSWLSDRQIIESYDKLVITYWEHWAKIFDSDNIINIPAVRNHHLVDTTWAWDAFRAWLLKGLNANSSWETSGRIWALLASFSLGSHWAQNHFIDLKNFTSWYQEEFAEELNLQ